MNLYLWWMTDEFKVHNQETVNEKSSGSLETIVWYYNMEKARSELEVRKKYETWTYRIKIHSSHWILGTSQNIFFNFHVFEKE